MEHATLRRGDDADRDAWVLWGAVRLFNINLGSSSDTDLERKLIDSTGSYGKQLGRICDVITVMLAHMEANKPIDPEDKAVKAFRRLANSIQAAKDEHRARKGVAT